MNANNANEPIDLNEIVQTWDTGLGHPLKRTRDTCDRDYSDLCIQYEKMARVSVYPEDLLTDETLITDPLEKPKLERQENTTYPEDIFKIKNIFEVLLKPLDDPLFIPNADLEQLDADLETAYHTPYPDDGPRPTREDGAHEEEEDDDFIKYNCDYNNKKLIEKYKKILKISEPDAFELLRRCHYCGTTKMKFGEGYCGERCQEYHYDFNYQCYWDKQGASTCIMCNWNDYYKNPLYAPDTEDEDRN